MPESVGVLRAVVLSQIYVEIGGPLGLLRIEAKGPGSPCGGRVREDLLRRVMHRVTNDEGSALRRVRTIVGIGVDLLRGLLDHPAHEIDMGDGVSELDDDEL